MGVSVKGDFAVRVRGLVLSAVQSDQWTEQNTMYLVSFSCFFLQFEKHVSSLFTKIHIRQFDAIVEIRNSEYCTEKIYRTY